MEHRTRAWGTLVVLAVVCAHVSAVRSVMPSPTGAPLPQASYSVDPSIPGLPQSFMVADAYPGSLTPVLNQGACGSCWAHSVAEVLSVRTRIYKGIEGLTLSPQDLLSCDDILKCEMGVLPGRAWRRVTDGRGLPTEQCVPYVSGDGHVPPCPSQCTAAGEPFTLYKAANYSHVGSFIDPAKHVAEIKAAVMRGAVGVTFNVFSAFMEYPSNGLVYDKCHLEDGGKYEGMHSVMIIGWDDAAPGGIPAWLVRNSWGVWGLSGNRGNQSLVGDFWIRMGVDCAGIESLVYEGFPA